MERAPHARGRPITEGTSAVTHAEDSATTLSTTSGRTDYWNGYYSSHKPAKRPLPSQFATFVAGELEGPHRVVELGCGNGRDALFFAQYDHEVVGVDASAAAVEACTELAGRLGSGATFVQASIDEEGLADRLGTSSLPTVVYARFFLHAITEEEEGRLLDLAAALTEAGGILAVEYRTERDASLAKVTDAHFRRYAVPAEVEERAKQRGFDPTYEVEGFGYAKYRHDNAYVARALFRKIGA